MKSARNLLRLPLGRPPTTTIEIAGRRRKTTTTAKDNFHQLIRQAIQDNQPCRLKHNIQIPIPTLVELWTTAISRKEPPISWIEWLFHSTIQQPQSIQSSDDQLKLTRFLSLALGLLIRSTPSPSDSNLHCWLDGIQEWEHALGPLPSNELDHRCLQIKRLLGQPVDDNLHILKDPYILSTLVRSADRPKEILERLGGSQDELLRTIRVSCRSKGQLIHRTQPDGPYQPMSSSEFQELLSKQPEPSLWKTGLILSQAECLVGQIRIIIEEQGSCKKLEEILKRLRELFDLNLAERERTLYGGQLEAHRLIRRQADGLEAILNHLLLSQPALAVDFGLVFELIDGAIARLGPDILRPRSWKLIISSHLKLSSQWTGYAGLERLFHLATVWSKSIPLPCPDHLAQPPIKFKKIMPGDIGLIMIERVLFPDDDLGAVVGKGKNSARCSTPIEQDRGVDEAFDRLVDRLQTMNHFLEAFGSPRRFKDHRLMRLIFLSVQKRNTQPDHSHLHYLQEEYSPSQPIGHPTGVGLDWWNRPDVWRDLEFRLSPLPPSAPPNPKFSPQLSRSRPQSQPQEHKDKEEELIDLSQLQFQLAHPSIPDSFHHPYGTGAGGFDDRPNDSKHEPSPASSSSPNLDPTGPSYSQSPHQSQTKNRNSQEDQKSAGNKAEEIAVSLDVVNQKLKTNSLDYFDQHSLLTCLVLLIRNKFHE